MVLVDGHVHLYECFDLGGVFDAAAQNFAAAARTLGCDAGYDAVLCLVESRRERFLAGVRSGVKGRIWRGRHGYWELEPSAEPEALVVRRGAARLHLFAGRQLVTRERLEVLALGTTAPLRDDEPIDRTLNAVREVGAAAVLPWGVGKWLGARGAVVARLLEDPRFGHVFLGDNANRLELAPEPKQLAAARRTGRRVLPGTDPLPLRGEEARVGSYGFAIDVPLDPLRPAAALLALLASGARFTPFGRCSPLTRFVGRQLALKWQNRTARAA
jgi:hypothetical protein